MIADLGSDYPIRVEPSPIDNGGKVIYELVLSDLLDPNFSDHIRFGLRETYRQAVIVAEQIRLQIEDRYWISKVEVRRDNVRWLVRG